MPTEPSGLEFVRQAPPAAGQATRISEGVQWLRMPLPFALKHINLWLLRDGECWTVVDTGIDREPVREAWRLVLPERRLTRQIVTHFHPDHLGLAAWLEQETGAALWMTHGEYAAAQLCFKEVAGFGMAAMMNLFRAHGLDEARLEAIPQAFDSYKNMVPKIPETFNRLLDGDEIEVGDRTWRVITGHGHAFEHAGLYCESLRTLISGDMLLPGISTNVSTFAGSPRTDMLGQFLASIDRFRSLPQDTLVLPSHGRPFRGIGARVEQLANHHRQRLEAVLAAVAERPMTAAALIATVFEREFSDDQQTSFAMGETIAHLIHLEKRQLVRRSVDHGTVHFAAA